jgi:hypothetical protein
VDEIGGAVDRVDDPLVRRIFLATLRVGVVVAEDRMIGKCSGDRRDDRIFRFLVGGRHDVAVLLRERRQPLQVARGVDDDGGRAPRRAHGDGEDRIGDHRCIRHHCLPAASSSCSISR